LACGPTRRARRTADHAQGPLRHHAAPHAARRHHGPRHDAAHLHHPGQPRLFERSGHGAEVPRRLALQPLATALFANSPFTEGKPNGFLSYRSHIWSDTDPARTGMLPFVFEDGFGYERYVEYMLDVPMYFVLPRRQIYRRGGPVVPRFPEGRAAGPARREADRISDWEDHLSTAFPEVRLKSFLEMRGADGGPWNRICALPALWVGLLYDQGALDAAWDLVKDWTWKERERCASVPKLGLDAPLPGGGTLRDIAGRSARDRVAPASTPATA
jgi:glutamate--cysteine ligase